jgi:hypothetical protein
MDLYSVLYCPQILWTGKIRKHTPFSSRNLKERDHLGDLGVDGSMNFRKNGVMMWTGSASRYGLAPRSCEHDNELSTYTGEFLP